MKKSLLAFIITVTACTLCLTGCGSKGPYILELDESRTYQTMSGWGTSMAWWAQTVPEDSAASAELARKLYSDEGIGLTIFRYNVPAGSWDLELYNNDADGRKVPNERNTDSAFIAELYDESKTAAQNFADDSKYDFAGSDVNAVDFMLQCLNQEGSTVEKVILFSNSPHYLLTESGMTHGAVEYQSNLPAENYEAFSEYLIKYVEYFRSLGIPVYSVSAINEPQHRWGGEDNASQEGCHYEPEEVAAFYNEFDKHLTAYNEANGCNVKMDPFESGNYDVYKAKGRVMEYIYELSKYDYFDKLDSLSVHSYGSPLSDEARNSFRYMLEKIYGDKFSVDMSEICQMEWGLDASMDSGLWLAEVIYKDMRYLEASSWSWWLGASGYDYNDGLLTWIWGSSEGGISATKRYDVLGQYSGFIKSGYTRIESGITDGKGNTDDNLLVTAYKGEGKTVVVITNLGDSAAEIGLPSGYTGVTAVVTDYEKSRAETYSGSVPDKMSLTAGSVTTLVFEK